MPALTGGIGSSLALELAERNHKLALIGKDKGRLIDLRNKIYSNDEDIYCEVIDFSNPIEDTVKNFFKKVFNRFGKIDNLINCIGICAWQKIDNFSLDLWNKIISINLTSTFLLNKYAVLYMKPQKKGTIVNISSVAGRKGDSYSLAYCASKSGVILLSQSLAREVNDVGIRVILLILGGVNTDFIKKSLGLSDENLKPYIAKKYSNDKKIDPKQIAIFITDLIEKDDKIMFKEILIRSGGAKG